MLHSSHRTSDPGYWSPALIVTAVIGILALFWASTLLGWAGLSIPGVRAIVGIVLVLFVPGALLTRLLGVRTRTFGRFALFSVGLSVVLLSVLTVSFSVVFPLLGVGAPLSVLPLALGLTAVVASLLALLRYTDTVVFHPTIDLTAPLPVVALVLVLPTLAATAAILMNQFGTNVGVFLLVGAVVVLVLLAATRFLPPNLYPVAVFSASLSILLHRNLLTDHVIGADIQATYFIAGMIRDAQVWSPDLGGTWLALPVVTAVPSTVTVLTGVELATTFKIVYALLFALVPVGVYYVGSEEFSDDVALFGSLFFLFYHGSFYFTPGKQLVAELFLVLSLLLLFGGGLRDTNSRLVALLLAIGLVQTHYGVTYVFALSMLVGAAGLRAIRRFGTEFDHELSLWYPVALLVGATAWYAATASELLPLLASIPASVLGQVVTLVQFGTIEGSGVTYVQRGTTLLEDVNLLLYVLFTGLVTIGLVWTLGAFVRRREKRDLPRPEFVALAVPFFVFLGGSYVLVFQLWADRVYQMVLPVLAPFMPLGYGVVSNGLEAVRDRFRSESSGGRGGRRPNWVLLAVLLGALLVFNSGLAFSLAGTAQTSTFNSEAPDLAFDRSERAGAAWLGNYANVERIEDPPGDVTGETAVTIYTDPTSYQLFRSVVPSGYYETKVLLLKSRWQPEVDSDRIGEGYVFVRERNIVDPARTDRVRVSTLTTSEADAVTTPRSVIYSSGDTRILRAHNGTVKATGYSGSGGVE